MTIPAEAKIKMGPTMRLACLIQAENPKVRFPEAISLAREARRIASANYRGANGQKESGNGIVQSQAYSRGRG